MRPLIAAPPIKAQRLLHLSLIFIAFGGQNSLQVFVTVLVVLICTNFEKHFTNLRKTPSLLLREPHQSLLKVGGNSKGQRSIFCHCECDCKRTSGSCQQL